MDKITKQILFNEANRENRVREVQLMSTLAWNEILPEIEKTNKKFDELMKQIRAEEMAK